MINQTNAINQKIMSVILISLTLFTACTFSETTIQSQPLQQLPTSEEPIKLGIISPITGGQAYIGELLRIGYDIAVEEINAKGGINGRPLQLVYEDDTADPKLAVTAFQKLTQVDGVKVVFPGASSSVLAIASLAEEEKVVSLAPVGSSTKIAKAGDYTFRIREKGELHGKAMAEYAFEKGLHKVAVLAVAHENGISYGDAFEARFKELGGRIVYSQTYEKDQADFRTELTKIRELMLDAVYLPGFVKSTAQQLKQAREVGLPAVFLSTVTMEDNQLFSIAGDAAEGLIYTSPLFDPHSPDPKVQAFMKKYKSKTSSETLIFGSANAYDVIRIIATVMQTCTEEGFSPKDTSCLKKELYSIKDYPGVGGMVTFDSEGEVVKPITFKTVKNKRFVEMEA